MPETYGIYLQGMEFHADGSLSDDRYRPTLIDLGHGRHAAIWVVRQDDKKIIVSTRGPEGIIGERRPLLRCFDHSLVEWECQIVSKDGSERVETTADGDYVLKYGGRYMLTMRGIEEP